MWPVWATPQGFNSTAQGKHSTALGHQREKRFNPERVAQPRVAEVMCNPFGVELFDWGFVPRAALRLPWAVE
jgi:hypothetical protein